MRIWKLIASLVVVGVLASAAFASAAKLNLNSQGVQAGNAIVPRCQGDVPVKVTYGTHWTLHRGLRVDTVTVSGIVPNCVSDTAIPTHTIRVVLTFNPVPISPQDLGTVPITGPTVVYSIPEALQPAAIDLTDVHVVIK